MHKMQCTLAELMNMLVTAELSMKGSKGSVFIVEQTSSKKMSFGKKKKSAKNQKVDGKKKKTESKKKATEKEKYFHCQSDGHWKRNCPQYLATLKNKKDGPSEVCSLSNLTLRFLLHPVGYLTLVLVLICALLCRVLRRAGG